MIIVSKPNVMIQEKAIITGDIIHSTKLSIDGRTWLLEQMSELFVILDKNFGTKTEIFRGDSFEYLCTI